MGNGEIRSLLESSKQKIKEKEAKEAYLSLVNELNYAVSYGNHANICERLKKVFPDNKECQEALPTDCWKEDFAVLASGVTTCFYALNEISNSSCQHDNIPLLKAICSQNIHEFLKSLRNEANINVTNQNKENGLHLAVKIGNENFASHLVSRKINIEAKDNNGNTPLMLAVERGNYEMTVYMLDRNRRKFNCNSQNNYGKNVIHIAMENYNSYVFDILANNMNCIGCSDITDKEGNTPLHLAAQNNNMDAVKSLLLHVISYNFMKKNNDGKTPIDLTTDPEIKKCIIDLLGEYL